MNETTGCYLVSWDFSTGIDKGILLVATKEKGLVTVINAFAGEEARDLYEKLTKAKDAE